MTNHSFDIPNWVFFGMTASSRSLQFIVLRFGATAKRKKCRPVRVSCRPGNQTQKRRLSLCELLDGQNPNGERKADETTITKNNRWVISR